MRALNFANRNLKEIIRDPFSIIFAIILPLFLLFIFQQIDIPNNSYKIHNFTPSIVMFSFSFITLFAGSLVAKDKTSSFLIRLRISPMKEKDFGLGYIFALLPLVFIQNVLFYLLAIIYGLEFNIEIVYSILASLPMSIFFIYFININNHCFSFQKKKNLEECLNTLF